MKIKNTSHKAKFVYWIILVVIVIILGVAAYIYTSRNSTSTDSQKVNNSPATTEQIEAGEDIKRSTVEQNEAQTKPNSNDPGPDFSVSITAASQNGAMVSIRSLISDTLSQTGTCTLSITNGSKSTTKTASTQALANSSTCQGFDIQTSELGAGTWNIQLNVTASSRATSTSKTLDVQ